MACRVLMATDAMAYRALRLEALQKHPEVFGSSYEEEEGFDVEEFARRLEIENIYAIGMFEGDQLVGIATLYQEEKQKLKHKANIFAVYVPADKRGLGIGKALMVEAINQARLLKDIEQLNLAVVTTNKIAKKLYVSLGFVVYGTEKNALKIDGQYFDEDYMVLVL